MFEAIVTEEGVKFNDLEKKIYKSVCKLGCMIIKSILENKDKKLMKMRDKKRFRHKGYKQNCIKTIMGEIEYERAVYLVEEDGEKKYVYLLDEEMKIETIGKVSVNLAEKALAIVVNTSSYRKGEEEIRNTTNETISHEGLRKIVIKAGEKIERREQEEIEMYEENKLIKGTKEIKALFEEADGIWINLQGKDREEQIEKNRKISEKQGKEYKEPRKIKSELKLHVAYEGWKEGDPRHSLVNKTYIAGMMSSKRLEKIRNAKIYQKYDEEKIELRVMNGDGARWIKNITVKGSISQKDNFHIHQEIVKDIKEEKHREEINKMIEERRYEEIGGYIEKLKYELGGEEKTVKKLKKLQSYLKDGLERYQEILEEQGRKIPESPKGIEYRNPGIMESQIFSVLKVRLGSGRKAFGKKGATYLAKICAIKAEEKGEIKLEKIEKAIKIDNSVEEWIKEIEENVKRNYERPVIKRKEKTEYKLREGKIERYPSILEVLKVKTFSELNISPCSY